MDSCVIAPGRERRFGREDLNVNGLVCDACDEGLLIDSDVRYVLKVEGFAAYDVLEISRAALERDLEKEMRETIEELQAQDATSAQDDVHRAFAFDLCPTCWKRFLQDPIAGARPALS